MAALLACVVLLIAGFAVEVSNHNMQHQHSMLLLSCFVALEVVQATVVQGTYVQPNGRPASIQMGQPIAAGQAGRSAGRKAAARNS